jgi:hypothetical protein
VFNNSLLTLDEVAVNDNIGRASGQGGVAQGGGIWNGVDLSGPPVQLTLTHSSVVGNALAASPGIDRQGGGLFTTSPVTLDHSLIVLNRPDQCVGCSASAGGTAGSTPHHRTRPLTMRPASKDEEPDRPGGGVAMRVP